MSEGTITLTCGHTDEPPVGIWEPEIDRHGNRCRSYSTYCPTCAEDASFVMVEQIEALEAKLVRYNEVVGDKINLRAEIAELKAEVERLREAVAEAVYMLDPEAEDVLKGAGIYRIVSAHVAAGGILPGDLKDALARTSTKKEKSNEAH